jgi:hypothetical protein
MEQCLARLAHGADVAQVGNLHGRPSFGCRRLAAGGRLSFRNFQDAPVPPQWQFRVWMCQEWN